ncbi:MAG: sulfurtransferase [Deltaproteobacteria bacterium]|nr:sulfurtransferase [Deltaproteobacteria bacterium]MBM4346720.1 sulfurtransferase [Deltaproteobacteria bacterium]
MPIANCQLKIEKTIGLALALLMGCFFFVSILLLPALLDAQPSPFKDRNFPRLIETKELFPLLSHPSIRIIDMRSSLLEYLKGHIPNSVYLHVETLHVPRSGIPAQGPDRIYLEKLIRDYLGVSNPMWIILYSEKSNPNATFLAWVLDHLGHKKVGILNGGWEKWVTEKFPVTQNYPSFSPGKFFGKVMPDTLAEKKWIRDHLSTKGVMIVDARSPKQYSGEEGEEIRRGHIPGAKNLFWETTLEGDEVRGWKKREDIEKLFAELGITKEKEIIVHCRTGREASHLYFTLSYVLGYPNVRLYRGSWVEWAADLNLPAKIGTDP